MRDYDFKLQYHPGKTNIVEDALSRKQAQMSKLMIKEVELIKKLQDMNLGMQLDQGHI